MEAGGNGKAYLKPTPNKFDHNPFHAIFDRFLKPKSHKKVFISYSNYLPDELY
jgi:hypothetical protein